MDCVVSFFPEVAPRFLLLTFPKSSVMQIKQILVSVCSFCFLSITMSSFAAGTFPEIDTRPLLRIGYIESSFSPFERKGFQDTFECLGLKKVDTFRKGNTCQKWMKATLLEQATGSFEQNGGKEPCPMNARKL